MNWAKRQASRRGAGRRARLLAKGLLAGKAGGKRHGEAVYHDRISASMPGEAVEDGVGIQAAIQTTQFTNTLGVADLRLVFGRGGESDDAVPVLQFCGTSDQLLSDFSTLKMRFCVYRNANIA